MSKLITERRSPKKQTKFTPPDLLKVPEVVKQRYPNSTLRWIKIGANVPIYGGQDVRGWELVHRDKDTDRKLEGLLSEFSVTALDSTYRIGDLVLAHMPKDRAEERNLAYLERNRTQTAAIQDPKRTVDALDRNKFQGDVEISRT